MAARSAGILMYRRAGPGIEVLLVHPGGPFWARKDNGAWMIPKGEYGAEEDAKAAARREFREELGVEPAGDLMPLGEIVQKGGKRVVAFALEGDIDPATIRSNEVEITWPPQSGRRITVPEVDRAEWMPLAEAGTRILPSQHPLIERLAMMLGDGDHSAR